MDKINHYLYVIYIVWYYQIIYFTWTWSYGSWIFNYLCNQCLSPVTWVRTPFMARCTRCNIMWYSLSVTCNRSMVFSGYSGFLHQQNWLPRYNWFFFFENGVKHHQPNIFYDTVRWLEINNQWFYLQFLV